MTWLVNLKDNYGTFWLVQERIWFDGETPRLGRDWSEDAERAKVYDKEGDACEAASKAQALADKDPDWYPKIKVVNFKKE